jgi:hypothetical protein
MGTYKITRPHRHTVEYETDSFKLEFEVELATNGVIFYKTSGKLISGDQQDFRPMADHVEAWLKDKYSFVDVVDS